MKEEILRLNKELNEAYIDFDKFYGMFYVSEGAMDSVKNVINKLIEKIKELITKFIRLFDKIKNRKYAQRGVITLRYDEFIELFRARRENSSIKPIKFVSSSPTPKIYNNLLNINIDEPVRVIQNLIDKNKEREFDDIPEALSKAFIKKNKSIGLNKVAHPNNDPYQVLDELFGMELVPQTDIVLKSLDEAKDYIDKLYSMYEDSIECIPAWDKELDRIRNQFDKDYKVAKDRPEPFIKNLLILTQCHIQYLEAIVKLQTKYSEKIGNEILSVIAKTTQSIHRDKFN